MSLITEIEKDAAQAKAWLQKEFKVVQTNFLPLAVTVTEYAKKAEDSGVVDAIALALSADTNGMSVAFNNDAKIAITKLLAVELQLEAVADNATPEQLGTTATQIDTSITNLAPKPKTQFFINLGVIALNVFKRLTGQTEAPTWMEDAIAVQNAYDSLKASLTVGPTSTVDNPIQEEGKAGVEEQA